jgi:tetratricopeptide (TPR) repeat protein
MLYYMQSRIDEAGALFAKAVEIVRRVLGDENPNALDAMHGLGVWYLNIGRDTEAETLLIKALEGRRRVLGEEHPDTQASMGMVYFKRGQYDKAEPLLVKALENERREEDWGIPPLISMYNLALLHHRQGDYDKAEPLLLEHLEISQRVLSEGHPDTTAAMNKIIKLYEDWGKPQKAEEWRSKLPRKKGTEEQ